MALADFIKTWTVLPDPTGELKGHKVEISVMIADTNYVAIDCQSDCTGAHAFNIGKYRAASNSIAGGTFMITIQMGIPNVITFSSSLTDALPGSWTANDSGGVGGQG
jgi:hypothetical protein